MEIRHLRYFTAAAEEQHFGRAAQRLHIAQPALSRQIRDLEEDLQVELFERLPRGVRLSSVGQSFLVHARRLLADFDFTRQNTRLMASGEIGNVRVGFIEPACQHRALPDSFRQFCARYPGVSLDLRPMHTTDQFVALAERRIDAGIVNSIAASSDEFERRTILTDPFKLALPESHPLSARKQLLLRDLRGEPFIWLRRDVSPGHSDKLLAACLAGDLTPRVVQEVSNEATILSLVSVGMGLGIVVSAGWRLPEGVVLKPLIDLTTTMQIDLVWRRTDRSPALQRLVDTVLTVTQQAE